VNRVVPYNEDWPSTFAEVRKKLSQVLSGLNVAVEHVGSTAVPGMWAKPILDVDIVTPTPNDVDRIVHTLVGAGFRHLGDRGIQGREVFEVADGFPFIHLYLVVEGTKPHLDHVLLRDYLRQHADAARRYSERKLAVAHLITAVSRQAYLEAKADVIDELLAAAQAEMAEQRAQHRVC
jgi:GrpB-like predicted nucleotidyltransferase (UPF0157 family)